MTEPLIEIQDIAKELGKHSLETCLFNLIVYSPSKERTKELDQMLEQLLEKFPCRVIQIEKINDSKRDEIKVTASREKLGKKGITCDFIHIFASENQLARVSFIVLPNIVADLPVYLIWGEDPTLAKNTLESLQSFSTRLIFNAAWSDHLQEFSQRMLAFLKTLKINVMDISWGSLSGFRNLLAEVFNSEEKVHFLRYAKKIHIRYAGSGPKDSLSAIYLQAFLAVALGWKLAAEEIQHDHQKALCYRASSHDINVILEQDMETSLPNGTITQFEAIGKEGHSYFIKRSKDGGKAVLHVSFLESCEMPCTFAIPDIHRGLNFLKEIFYKSSGDHYTEVLEMLAKVNWDK